ncbi:MAG TPA: oligosaccharide flippase family protein [Verrucomicrobiae bacterium]|nr:oligosaccharide flippase family protein [Verrucomicrobiae bacterium]
MNGFRWLHRSVGGARGPIVGGEASRGQGPYHRSLIRPAFGLLAGNAFNNAMAFVITLYSGSLLPAAAFGELGVALASIVLVATLTDWGSSTALVRVAARDPSRADTAGDTVLLVKLLLGVTIVLLSISEDGLQFITAAGAAVLGVWMSARASDQARGDFRAMQWTSAACGVLRLCTFCAVLAYESLTAGQVIFALYVFPQCLLLLPRLVLLRAPDPESAMRVLMYARWTGLASVAFVAFTRAPLFIAAILVSQDELGVLAGALTATLVFAMLGDALRSVALPQLVRAASRQARDAARAWLPRASFPAFAVAALALIVACAHYEQLLGAEHARGAVLLLAMGGATLIAAALGLPNALLHARGEPQLEALVNLARLTVFGFASVALPLSLESIAWTYALVLVVGELGLFALARRGDDLLREIVPGKFA